MPNSSQDTIYKTLLSQRSFVGVFLVILFIYIFVALTPFQWDPPRQNGLSVTKHNTLNFPSPGIAHSKRAPEWLGEAIRKGSFKVKMRVRSYSADQTGPARLFTISTGPYWRNFTIGQNGSALIIRIRTSDKNINGLPELSIPNIFEEQHWQDILVEVVDNKIEISINSKVVLHKSLPENSFDSWNPSYGFAFGNEWTDDRPWLGEISQTSVSVNTHNWNLLSHDLLEIPSIIFGSKDLRYRWRLPAYSTLEIDNNIRKIQNRKSSFILDFLLNFVCFIPFGYALTRAMGKKHWIAAAIVCSLLSLSMEVLQLFFALRVPSQLDWISNSAGGFVGALIIRKNIMAVILKSQIKKLS